MPKRSSKKCHIILLPGRQTGKIDEFPKTWASAVKRAKAVNKKHPSSYVSIMRVCGERTVKSVYCIKGVCKRGKRRKKAKR